MLTPARSSRFKRVGRQLGNYGWADSNLDVHGCPFVRASGLQPPGTRPPLSYVRTRLASKSPEARAHCPSWTSRRALRHQDLSGNDRIVVFDSTAAPVGVLTAEFPMPIVFLPDGRALIQVVDSVDVERIGILDMIPGEG